MANEGGQARVGVKVDQAVKESLDKDRIPVSKAADDQEVQGQYNGYVQCPYCGFTGFVTGLDANYYINVQCGSCGSIFLA